MDYEKIYNALCDSRKYRGVEKEAGYEVHHILPRSMGGSDEDKNLVKFTYREHYIAHKLLVKFVDPANKYKMLKALVMMSDMGRYSIAYSKSKAEFVKFCKEAKERFLIVPKYISSDPYEYFQKLNSLGYHKVLIPIATKEYYNPLSNFTVNKVRGLIDRYNLPFRRSFIFTEVDITLLGTYPDNFFSKDIAYGCESYKDRNGIKCHIESLGYFINPVPSNKLLKTLQSVRGEHWTGQRWCKPLIDLHDNLENFRDADYNLPDKSLLKDFLGLARYSSKYDKYFKHTLLDLHTKGAAKVPRISEVEDSEILKHFVNCFIISGNYKVYKGYNRGDSWFKDVIVCTGMYHLGTSESSELYTLRDNFRDYKDNSHVNLINNS